MGYIPCSIILVKAISQLTGIRIPHQIQMIKPNLNFTFVTVRANSIGCFEATELSYMLQFVAFISILKYYTCEN